MKARVAAIVGPTAVGKTQVSVSVAERLGAEIVSVDSMQIYRGMDIGTDKAPEEARRRVAHHLLDLRDPSHDLTVAEFQRLARAAIADIAARGRVPLLVGGSGLYFRAVVDDLDLPPRSEEVREALEAEAEVVGAETLHARLAAIDPRAASRIDPANLRRTIRALEVIELTGRRFSDADTWDRYESIYDLRAAGVARERADLFARIDERVERMLDGGLIEETRRIARSGFGRTASQALGYRQVLEAAPEATREEIHTAIATATRRFARRQESWFRADPRIAWFDAADPDVVEKIGSYLNPSR